MPSAIKLKNRTAKLSIITFDINKPVALQPAGAVRGAGGSGPRGAADHHGLAALDHLLRAQNTPEVLPEGRQQGHQGEGDERIQPH